MNVITNNSPFHVRYQGIHYSIIERDVTAGVHSVAVLGYLSTAFYGNNAVLYSGGTARAYEPL